jgi:hypothetical protein
MSGWQLIRLAAVSLLSRVSSITAKHHNNNKFLTKLDFFLFGNVSIPENALSRELPIPLSSSHDPFQYIYSDTLFMPPESYL